MEQPTRLNSFVSFDRYKGRATHSYTYSRAFICLLLNLVSARVILRTRRTVRCEVPKKVQTTAVSHGTRTKAAPIARHTKNKSSGDNRNAKRVAKDYIGNRRQVRCTYYTPSHHTVWTYTTNEQAARPNQTGNPKQKHGTYQIDGNSGLP